MSYASASAETGNAYGKHTETIFAKDTQDLALKGFEYSSGFHKWWEEFLLGNDREDESITGVQSIQTLDADAVLALSATNVDVISKTYLVAESEVADFVEFCKTADAEGKTPVVLHFATSDYFSTNEVYIGTDGKKPTWFYGDRQSFSDLCYIAKEDVFLDFTMIQMDFVKDAVHTVIPVNTQPIDIIPGTDAPSDQGSPNKGSLNYKGNTFLEWLASARKWLLIIAAVIVMILVIILFIIAKKAFTDNFVTRSIVGDYYDRKREKRQNEVERERAERNHRYAMELEREKQKAPKKDKKK